MKVAILGGGLSGLVSAQAFKDSAQVTIIEPGRPGGTFAAGGFKYFHATEAMQSLCDNLSLQWCEVPIKGGILLDGSVRPYPDHLRQLPEPQALDIMRAHFDKTRGDGEFTKTAMNDPWGHKPDKLITDVNKFIEACMRGVDWMKASARSLVTPNRVETTNGSLDFDLLVNTLPLWIFGRMMPKDAHGETPDLMHKIATATKAATTRVTVLKCLTASNRLAGYDYVYTPFTKSDVIHRVSLSQSWYDCETTKSMDHQLADVFSDLESIFGEQPHVIGGVTLNGHVKRIEWLKSWMGKLPEQWLHVGRFAQWDGRCTVDKAYSHALELARRHIRG